MENILRALPHTFIPIFIAIDVFAILPIFISLTVDMPDSRKQIIRDSIFTALIVGPAVLTTILVLVDHYGIIPTILSLLINLFIIWISFINAERIINLLGKGTIIGISRIMALLLASIAVMMIRLGVSNFIRRSEERRVGKEC